MTFELVSNERDGHGSWTGDAKTLEDPAGEHDGECPGNERQRAAGGKQRQADVDGGLAADAVRHRSVEELSQSKPEKEQRDDELCVVGVANAQSSADCRKRRKDHVDRQRNQRRQGRHEPDELYGTDAARACVVHAGDSFMETSTKEPLQGVGPSRSSLASRHAANKNFKP